MLRALAPSSSSRPYSGRTRVALHLLLWALYIGFQYFLMHLQPTSPAVMLCFIAKDLLTAVVGFYFFSNVVLPRFVVQRRWLLSALSLVAIYYFWALVSHATYAAMVHSGLELGEWSSYMHRSLDKGLWVGVFSWYGVSMGLSDFFVFPMQPILLRFILFLLTSSNRSLHLQRENLRLEVNFLKAQVNPHFLFNTLNNIYMMVVKQDERAPDMVAHLSHLMHYTVYESDAALVPLGQELGFLEAYLELERLRYGQKVSIRYQPPVRTTGYAITPLLFFPFVENAFKHGVDSSLDASWVAISLRIFDDARLHFEVRNSYSPDAPQREFGGVGIANVRKRLALHYSPADYELTISHDADAHTYGVALTILLEPVSAAVGQSVPSLPALAPAS
ncbi:Histidine kinase [Hymenobacter gelipurpurascens]|uniref:Histidine kinase n=1 Tax=Hymenobacter gelipurpurascens TaxID=89968 RepID=A0A212TDR6_9BACT|nr:histidine kinase [Hymenobacter gelipurpurascens]SNC63984.1 Histidine kinase [Hymenobacter gelipurpurascens]